MFVGGFALELAQEVAADDEIDRWAVLDVLGHLVDKSLVVADGEELPRYRMLETVRAFALEQLAASARLRLCCAGMPKRCSPFSCRSTTGDLP